MKAPDSMRVAIYRAPGVLEVGDHPRPGLCAGDVLVEVSHCGICGTDLHLVMEGMGRPDTIGGHEYAGVIAALGPAVVDWQVGDRVVADPNPPACGRCELCRAARPSLCLERPGPGADPSAQGAFAQYVRVVASQLHRVPEGVSLRHAALCEPLAVALHAIRVSGVQADRSVLISGAGPIGALVLAALRAEGVQDVRVSEPAPLRREHARGLGAVRVLHPDELETPALPYERVPDAVDVVFECSGQPAAMESGLAQLRPGGTLVFVGTGLRRPRLDANRILLNELRVTGSYNYDADGFERALAMLADGRVPADRLIESGDVPLGGLLGAIEQLASGKRAGKVLVVPGPAH